MMSEVLHANIFFLIASVATVVFCILISVALYQVIKILQAIRVIITRIEAGSEAIAEDITYVRSFVKSGGMLTRAFGLFSPARRSRRTKNDVTEN